MAHRILGGLSGRVLVGIVADPFDQVSKVRKFYPARLLEELEATMGPLSSEEAIEAAIDRWAATPEFQADEALDLEAITAEVGEDAYFALYSQAGE